jgi:hypothetical protein
MQVDVRIALNQLWDNGGQHGQESEEGESKEEKDRQEEVGLRQRSRSTSKADTHQGACALPPARLILPRLDEVQRLKQTQAGSARAQALTDPAFSLKVPSLSRAALRSLTGINGVSPRTARFFFLPYQLVLLAGLSAKRSQLDDCHLVQPLKPNCPG